MSAQSHSRRTRLSVIQTASVRMSENETVNFRLDLLEKERTEMSRTLSQLAKSQMEMSADIRILIKEQMRLTQTLRGIASYQHDVKQMHSTQTRLFNRIERIETSVSTLRDDFHVYRARQDGRAGVLAWIADHWQFVTLLSAGVLYVAWMIKQVIR